MLAKVGPEPLSDEFNGPCLYDRLNKQKRAIKVAIMDNKNVVGVGNIYANEALFRSQIHPATPALNLTYDQCIICLLYTSPSPRDRQKCIILADNIKEVLHEAIIAGGSTLRDFVNSDGKNGYFQLQHDVYGRVNQPCKICGQLIEKISLGQRSSFFCPICQK